MKHLKYLREQQKTPPAGEFCANELIRFRSFRETYGKTPLMAGALAQKAWFENYPVHVYEYDRIAGSRYGNYLTEYDSREMTKARQICGSYGYLDFRTNSDHFAPGYDRFLKEGICGTMARIEESLIVHKEEAEKVEFLTAQKEVLTGFASFVRRHSDAARETAEKTENLPTTSS